MKFQRFRLESVLRHYRLQKQRVEIELQKAFKVLRELDADILKLGAEIDAVAEHLLKANLDGGRLIACCRSSEALGRRLDARRKSRDHQVKVIAALHEHRKQWAVREESLISLKDGVDQANQAELSKAHQLQLDETVLRNWHDSGMNHET